MNELGMRLRELRRSKGLSQKELARRLYITQTTVWAIETNQRKRLGYASKRLEEYVECKGHIPPRPRVQKRNFRVGQRYVIDEHVMEYEGRHGKNHVFRETNGGWRETYTLDQLTGKEVKVMKK